MQPEKLGVLFVVLWQKMLPNEAYVSHVETLKIIIGALNMSNKAKAVKKEIKVRLAKIAKQELKIKKLKKSLKK